MAPYRKEKYLLGRKSFWKEWLFYKVDVLVSANKSICETQKPCFVPTLLLASPFVGLNKTAWTKFYPPFPVSEQKWTFYLLSTSVFYIVSGDVVKFKNWDVISGVF